MIVAYLALLPTHSPDVVDEIGRHLEIRIGKDRWLFESRLLSEEQYFEDVVTISKNRRFIKSPQAPNDKWFPGYAYYKFTRPRIETPYPVVVIRGHTGAGSGQGTRFYRIYRGKLQLMGHAPNKHSNGPVLWRKKTDHWLFDNEDVYDMREPNWVRQYKLYRITKEGKLKFVRHWQAPRNKPLRDTIALNF